ncbi:MAG TPA: hypothetical protein VGD50_07160, partial [Candidatus Baltobacteraceae bacterium]
KLQATSMIASDHIAYILINDDIYRDLHSYPEHYRPELAMEARALATAVTVYRLSAQPGHNAGPALTLLRVR